MSQSILFFNREDLGITNTVGKIAKIKTVCRSAFLLLTYSAMLSKIHYRVFFWSTGSNLTVESL